MFNPIFQARVALGGAVKLYGEDGDIVASFTDHVAFTTIMGKNVPDYNKAQLAKLPAMDSTDLARKNID